MVTLSAQMKRPVVEDCVEGTHDQSKDGWTQNTSLRNTRDDFGDGTVAASQRDVSLSIRQVGREPLDKARWEVARDEAVDDNIVVELVKRFREVKSDDFDSSGAADVAMVGDVVVKGNKCMARRAMWTEAILRSSKLVDEHRTKVFVHKLFENL